MEKIESNSYLSEMRTLKIAGLSDRNGRFYGMYLGLPLSKMGN